MCKNRILQVVEEGETVGAEQKEKAARRGLTPPMDQCHQELGGSDSPQSPTTNNMLSLRTGTLTLKPYDVLLSIIPCFIAPQPVGHFSHPISLSAPGVAKRLSLSLFCGLVLSRFIV